MGVNRGFHPGYWSEGACTPLWDLVAVVAMGLLVWWIWHELPDRKQAAPRTQNGGSVEDTADSTADVAKLHKELFEARSQLADASNQLHRREQQRAEEAAKQRQRAELLDQAPQLLIHYSNTGSIETLEFINDGPSAVIGVSVGPLTWKEDRLIGLHSQLPPIPAKNREAVRMCFQDSPHSTAPMDGFIGGKNPPDAASVSVNYQDSQGTLFVRDFLLRSFPDGRLVWNPGPVRLQN